MKSNRRNRLIQRIEKIDLWTVAAGSVRVGDCGGARDRIDSDALSGLADTDTDVGSTEKCEAGIVIGIGNRRIVVGRSQCVRETVGIENALNAEHPVEVGVVRAPIGNPLNQNRPGISGIQAKGLATWNI